MELALPPEVRAVLRDHGVEPAGPLGVGASGLRWSALGADGRRYAVVHASGTLAEAVRDRARVLAGLRHPALAHCAHVLPTADGVVVLVEADPGTDAGVLLEARGALRPGEVVGLLAPVAEALAVLHGAGLAHGDVAPSNIVVTARGPVLVDVLGGADGDERGTPAFTPPEREAGPSPEADVAALGLVALALLGGPAGARREGDDDAADVGAGAGGRAALEGWCARTAGADPPTAGELAAGLRRACPAAPLEPADPAVLARLGLRRLSGTSGAVDRGRMTVRLARGGRRAQARHRAAGAADREGRRAVRRRDRPTGSGTRRQEVRRAVLRGVLVGSVVLGGLGGAAVAVAVVGRDESVSRAAVRLTRERAAALALGDAEALARVTVPGSPAARADALALTAAAGDAAGRLDAEPSAWTIAVVPEATVPCDGAGTCVRVRTVTSWGGVAGEPRTVVLVLAADPWRVREVRTAG